MSKQTEAMKLALEAGFNHPRLETETDYYRLERFAALVAEKERKSMMQLFTDPENQPTQHGTVTVEYMQREIASEREACAKLCDAFQARGVGMQPAECAGAIRARGNT